LAYLGFISFGLNLHYEKENKHNHQPYLQPENQTLIRTFGFMIEDMLGLVVTRNRRRRPLTTSQTIKPSIAPCLIVCGSLSWSLRSVYILFTRLRFAQLVYLARLALGSRCPAANQPIKIEKENKGARQ